MYNPEKLLRLVPSIRIFFLFLQKRLPQETFYIQTFFYVHCTRKSLGLVFFVVLMEKNHNLT